jgi:hypothetical protein
MRGWGSSVMACRPSHQPIYLSTGSLKLYTKNVLQRSFILGVVLIALFVGLRCSFLASAIIVIMKLTHKFRSKTNFLVNVILKNGQLKKRSTPVLLFDKSIKASLSHDDVFCLSSTSSLRSRSAAWSEPPAGAQQQRGSPRLMEPIVFQRKKLGSARQTLPMCWFRIARRRDEIFL